MTKLTMILPGMLFIGSFASFASCAGSLHLTDEQASKLDPQLRPLLEGKAPASGACAEVLLKDGTVAYVVTVRGSEAEIRQAGYSPGSVIGDILTLTVPADGLLRLATLPSVRRIECGHSSKPQH
jgi:hypothetical protein